MKSPEFGFDTGESLHGDLIAAREAIGKEALDADSRNLKLPFSHSQLVTTVEYFLNVLSGLKPELLSKVFRLDAVRKAVYGLDSVSFVRTDPLWGVALNDYEMSLITRALNGDYFTVIDILKDNRADSFMLVNNLSAKAVMQNHPDAFDDIAKADPITYIRKKLVKPLVSGQQPPNHLQYGLLSGFPRESVTKYPYFDSIRRKFPKFARIYVNYLGGEASTNDVYEVINGLPIDQKGRAFLFEILREHARFNDRRALTIGGFIMLTSADLYYAERRELWFRHFDSVYKPVVQNQSGEWY